MVDGVKLKNMVKGLDGVARVPLGFQNQLASVSLRMLIEFGWSRSEAAL